MLLSSSGNVRVSLSRTMQTLSTLERRREESKAGEPQVLMGCGQGRKARGRRARTKEQEEAASRKRRRETRPGAPRWCKFSVIGSGSGSTWAPALLGVPGTMSSHAPRVQCTRRPALSPILSSPPCSREGGRTTQRHRGLQKPSTDPASPEACKSSRAGDLCQFCSQCRDHGRVPVEGGRGRASDTLGPGSPLYRASAVLSRFDNRAANPCWRVAP